MVARTVRDREVGGSNPLAPTMFWSCMAICRKHCWVSGRVQGVGFRYYACRRARDLGLSGWVRNLTGGRVEIEAQGDEDRLEQFLADMRLGPGAALVRDVRVEDCQTLATYETFTIESSR